MSILSSKISQFIRDDDICGQLLKRIKSSDPHGDNAEDGSGVLSNAVCGSAESHDSQNLPWSAEEAQQGQLGSVDVVSLHRMVIARISGGVMALVKLGSSARRRQTPERCPQDRELVSEILW